jgi:hypothetical protein
MRRLLGVLFLGAIVWSAIFLYATAAIAAEGFRLATFRCDVTPPKGQPLFTCEPIETIESPLLAKGVIIESDGDRYVLCAVDWCTLGGESYKAFQEGIAAAAATQSDRVALQTVHQHTAPMVDRSAAKLLAEAGVPQFHISAEVENEILKRLTDAVREAAGRMRPFDTLGTGQAKVDRVASCRRAWTADGKLMTRTSSCKEPQVRDLPEGTIDPYLKTITLAKGDKPLVRLHYYATHPQTLYRDGRASWDFVGDVREQVEKEEGVCQIYFNGCGGDITVGKYNDGSKQNRAELTERLLAGMKASIAAMRLKPLGHVGWRTCPLQMEARDDKAINLKDSLALIKNEKEAPVARLYHGAIRAAFLAGEPKTIMLSALELDGVRIVHLPGEPMVCFQTYAQESRPGEFTAVAGYGEGGPCYLCPEKAFAEGGYEPSASLVKPDSETRIKKAIAALLAD